jgi:GTP-binding protein HflX
VEKEIAILAGVGLQKDAVPVEESLEELRLLAQTAGAQVAGDIIQHRQTPDIRYFIGKGKVEEIKPLIARFNANLLIMDNDISPSQARNLEEVLKVRTIGRTELILDIFAQHAHSQEGRLQVELAQAEFSLTRLMGKGVMMSRLGGGIGTRGPGETKLEQDRRKIRAKVSELKKLLEGIRKSRGVRRNTRQTSGIKSVSIVGYTNAGKSTLINALTNAGVLTQDKLFATLDTTTRRLYLDENTTVLISDTVGFIKKLPHQLVNAFRATLEEVADSDVLIHVVDASNPHFENQISAVYTVLE